MLPIDYLLSNLIEGVSLDHQMQWRLISFDRSYDCLRPALVHGPVG
ncbi:hypothetical protein HN018_25100 (plasmid) [Lichenicola cladoniae]|uniref:Uncharacterized protein n=1 Tax=Lichenicola cladoniae TaxID=1484109 RepID=A0A6M8HYX2_9PROT|nr:hypothetical protein [Lichenicola cladoniae]NPD69577.1 hypothetical protein [Acetobacteraceae bacterium]QKE93456.1 hypothetical protein HN018_25100 [Lichenicola cladoniae]